MTEGNWHIEIAGKVRRPDGWERNINMAADYPTAGKAIASIMEMLINEAEATGKGES